MAMAGAIRSVRSMAVGDVRVGDRSPVLEAAVHEVGIVGELVAAIVIAGCCFRTVGEVIDSRRKLKRVNPVRVRFGAVGLIKSDCVRLRGGGPTSGGGRHRRRCGYACEAA
jgi:hypothetical protein